MNEAVLFYPLAVLTVCSALGVALSQNIVRMAVCLLFTLTGVAGLYLLLDAEFVAAVQLVVYAGGILVLIIFGIMLTGSGAGGEGAADRRGGGEVLLAVLAAGVIAGALGVALWPGHAQFAANVPTGGGKGLVPLGIALLGEFLVPFELLSVLLLVVMIGAAYLAASRRRAGAGPGGAS